MNLLHSLKHPFSPKGRKNLWILSLIALLLVLPNIFYLVHVQAPLSLILKYTAISLLFVLNPVILFYRNIKVYLYVLSFFALLAPMVCFSIHLFDLKMGARMAGLVFQTNLNETKEISQGYRLPFILVTILYLALYLFCVNKLSLKNVGLKWAALISLVSIAVVWMKMYHLKRDFHVTSMYGIIDEYFPASVLSSTLQVLFTAPNNLDRAKNFSFGAYRKDTGRSRQIYVLIIGESSRYDHWQINGYSRPTSPRVEKRKNLITFSNVAAGAHFTWLAVPQIITRASPGHMEKQFSEKSILSAFKDAGFKTIWLSNQDPDYYTGSFTLHAQTADLCIFPGDPTIKNTSSYDERFLPVMDSLIRTSKENLFIVLHTMGSHWEYSKRYPDHEDYFTPSGKTTSINPPKAEKKEAIINSYDNSIRYTDYIIDSTISVIDKYRELSAVAYISDHGEDLFDTRPDQLNFHLTASEITLHVPLFIWTSNEYNARYPDKQTALKVHSKLKISANNIFYTMIDMADITFPSFDSTSSISSEAFQEKPQQFIEQGQNVPTDVTSVK